MQKIEQKVSSNGDRCAKAATEGAPPTVTPALIKNAAAALAELMRQHESGGIHKVRPSTLSTLMSLQKLGEMSQSDDEVVDVESVGDDDDDKSRSLQSSKSSRSTESVHLNAETRARLRALLESTGLGKLSTSDTEALSDPEVLQRLTDKVSSAMDEAASTLLRIKAEQQKTAPTGSSSSDVDIGHLTLDDGQLCPAELEQALQGDSLLLMACSAGYYQLAQVLLALKSDVEDRGTKGDRTPLMEAACGGYLDIVRLLLAHKANVNTQAPSGNTALHYAACGGYIDVASELVAAGAHVEQPNENGHTPLMEAATAGHVDVAAVLLARGANINMHSTEFKESALTLACYKGHLDMVRFLLEQGADLEHKTDEMHTALMEASMDGHVDVARYLLDHGAQVNMPADSFESPLTLAACGGHTELAALLVERGANMEEVNDEGYTPLMEAVREGHEDVVTLLIHRGADVNAQTEETQETALTLACCGGFLEIAELLINSGANLELGCSTALMEAAQEGHVELVKYLIAAGANVNAQTFTKGTALTYASENGHTEVSEVLVHHGAALDHESEGGRTALMRAAKSGHQLTVEFLVSKGANVNKTTCSNDHSVLSLACNNGHLDVVVFLLKSGADVSHRLKDGSTMLMEAAKGGHFDIMSLLLDWPTSSPAAVISDNTAASRPHKSDVAAAADKAIVSSSDSNAGREVADGVSFPTKCSAATETLDTKTMDAGSGDSSWEAFVGKMACKGELLGLDREEQIVVKQQMLDRLMLLERELQERTGAGKSSPVPDQPATAADILDDSNAAATATRMVVVDDGLRGDEELAIAILEKAVLGETVLDRVVLEQLKTYMRTGGVSDEDVAGAGGEATAPGECLDDIVRDLDNLSVSVSSSEEGDNFEDACGDMASPVDLATQSDRLEKHASVPARKQHSVSASDIRTPAEGLDAQAQAKLKDRPVTKGQRRSTPKSPSVPSPAAKPSKAACVETGARPATKEQMERNVMLQQQREHLQAQLVLQQQLHNELEQHLKLQQEHDELQAQLMVKEAAVSSQASGGPGSGNPSSTTTTLDYECCHEHHVSTQHRQQHLVQQKLQQLHHQLQQVAGHSAIDSFQQAQQQAMHLARLHQKHSNLAAAAAAGSITQSTQTAAADNGNVVAPARANNAPVTGNAATLTAQKKAADLAACSGRSTRPSAGTQTHGSTGTPCPNCCMDAGKQARAAGGGKTSVPIEVDAQTESNHDTALTLAAAGGHARLVALLLTRGADVEHRDKKGLTPLILASAAGHMEVCEVLLQHKADIDNVSDKNKDTALSLACSNGRYEVVELLLSKGANKEHRNISDYTPLSQAASGGFVNVIKVLLAHGAEINSRTGSKMGISPLMLAAMNGHTAAVKLLLDMGSDINAQIETNKNTALTLACFQGRYEVVSLLIDRKANIEHRAKTGLTPLMEAASGGYVEVGRVLLDKGADIAATPVPVSRDTALTIAADKGHHRFVELLLTRGAAVDVKNKKGNTPLWLACNGGYVEVVQLLVTHGADVHSEDNRHVSCIMIAFRKAHVKVIKVLVRHVTQFPPDHDCLRYIATLTDKEMIKRCHQCMNMIVGAKEHQAAEANKNAAILLEELSQEREREETKKAAAARKRDRKKMKKKERADRDKEDSAASSSLVNSDVAGGDDVDNLSDEMLTSSADKTWSQGDDVDQQQQLATAESTHNIDDDDDDDDVQQLNCPDETDKPAVPLIVSESEVSPRNNESLSVSSASVTETSRRSRRGRRDRHKKMTTTTVDSLTKQSCVESSRNKSSAMNLMSAVNKEMSREGVMDTVKLTSLPPAGLSITGIGDLDDFGCPSSVPTVDKGSTSKKPADRPPRTSTIDQKSATSSTKKSSGTPGKSGAGKKGSRKEDEWEEVSRKSKRLLVPANTISRVIGRGGCNINAIRDISTAQVEIDRSRDSTTERIITIKGSMEATKYAQSLIEALINDTDKKFEQQLPKMKPLQAPPSSGQKHKSASTTKSHHGNGAGSSGQKDDQSSKPASVSKIGGAGGGAWQQASSVAATSAWSVDPSPLLRPSQDGGGRMSYSDRAKAIITSESSSVSKSPPASSTATTVNIGSGGGGGVQLPQPLPIVSAAGFTGPSRLSATTSSSVMRHYSPFNNALSQIIAESVLTKRTDDFASVAAAGVVTSSPPLSDEPTAAAPPPAPTASDPHKAPGYKVSDPTKAPGHQRLSKDPATSSPRVPSTGTLESSLRSTDFLRPQSTPSSGVALGASLDRPESFYMRTCGYRPPLNVPPSLMQFDAVHTGDVRQFATGHGAVTETSVLAAPLMATSLASACYLDNNTGLPHAATATAELEGVIDDDRRPLGPIGTERASRRPPAAAAVHLADMNVMPPPPPAVGDDVRDSWNMYTDGSWGNMALFGTSADEPVVMTTTGLPVDNGVMHAGYPDMSAMMMMSDVYHSNAQHLKQPQQPHHVLHASSVVGGSALMMPPAAMFAADAAAASFNGMMPTLGHLQGTSAMLMNPDSVQSAGWSANQSDVTANYLSTKAGHMMWNHNWAPSANI